jgi:glyceraldehyde 3-phosphate dehydrogenase
VNGFGRVGRLVVRKALVNPEVELVAINSRADAATDAHLLKYDSVHGTYKAKVRSEEGYLYADDRRVKVLSETHPSRVPWGELGVDVVIESTGAFKTAEDARIHLNNGAKKVVITAPAKNEDITIILGVNEDRYDPQNHHIISYGSCTTNCLAPIAKVISRAYGIKMGLMTTVHSYTNDQRILDRSHKDLRRARAAALSIIPTTTGAAKAVAKVLPELEGKLSGFAMRVPVPNVSVVDLVIECEQKVTAAGINETLQAAAAGELQGILGYSDEPLVSQDYNGDERSGIVDGLSTMTIKDTMAKIVAWYDNEWGYACRILD